jgi:hypothetical protein
MGRGRSASSMPSPNLLRFGFLDNLLEEFFRFCPVGDSFNFNVFLRRHNRPNGSHSASRIEIQIEAIASIDQSTEQNYTEEEENHGLSAFLSPESAG